MHRGTGRTDGRTVDVGKSDSSDWLAVRWAVGGKTGGALRTEYEAPACTLQQFLAESWLLLPVARLNALKACTLPTAAMVQLKMQCHGYTRLYTATLCPQPPSLWSCSSPRLSCPILSLLTDRARTHHL